MAPRAGQGPGLVPPYEPMVAVRLGRQLPAAWATVSIPVMYSTNIGQVSLQARGPKAGATDGAPFESLLMLYADEKIYSGIWECTPGAFPVTKDGSCEYMTFLAGDATIHGDDGVSYEVGPGTALFIPDGWRGRWEIRATVRKSFVIVETR